MPYFRHSSDAMYRSIVKPLSSGQCGNSAACRPVLLFAKRFFPASRRAASPLRSHVRRVPRFCVMHLRMHETRRPATISRGNYCSPAHFCRRRRRARPCLLSRARLIMCAYVCVIKHADASTRTAPADTSLQIPDLCVYMYILNIYIYIYIYIYLFIARRNIIVYRAY